MVTGEEARSGGSSGPGPGGGPGLGTGYLGWVLGGTGSPGLQLKGLRSGRTLEGRAHSCASACFSKAG